ncbi:MAG TPA: fatty acid desaturase, partial [Deinococcales bacterium]|nr:fatty acid desaturase [Deinococcales bacterium]
TRRALEDGIRRTRLVPDLDGSGDLRGSAIWESFDPSMVENDVKRLYDKIVAYERGIGFDEVDPFSFQPNPHWPRSGETGEAND